VARSWAVHHKSRSAVAPMVRPCQLVLHILPHIRRGRSSRIYPNIAHMTIATFHSRAGRKGSGPRCFVRGIYHRAALSPCRLVYSRAESCRRSRHGTSALGQLHSPIVDGCDLVLAAPSADCVFAGAVYLRMADLLEIQFPSHIQCCRSPGRLPYPRKCIRCCKCSCLVPVPVDVG